MAEARKIKFPNAPASKIFTYDSKIPQAVATTIWQTDPLRGNQREFRRLNLLGDILGDRLREEIREKLGASYSPNAGAAGSDALDNMGYLISQSIGKPEDVQLLLDTMREQADKLAAGGATDDELDRALKPVLGMLEKSLRDNGYWLGTVMSECQADPAAPRTRPQPRLRLPLDHPFGNQRPRQKIPRRRERPAGFHQTKVGQDFSPFFPPCPIPLPIKHPLSRNHPAGDAPPKPSSGNAPFGHRSS